MGLARSFVQDPFEVPENYNAWSKGLDFLESHFVPQMPLLAGSMGGAGGLLVKRFLRPVEMRTPQPALNEARGVVESEMGRGGSGCMPITRLVRLCGSKRRWRFKALWLDAGVDVPRGVHPLIDQIKEKTNDAWVDKIQNAFARGAELCDPKDERDPGAFKNFAQQHFADAQMGISADAVVRLYGDKLPSREDGIL